MACSVYPQLRCCSSEYVIITISAWCYMQHQLAVWNPERDIATQYWWHSALYIPLNNFRHKWFSIVAEWRSGSAPVQVGLCQNTRGRALQGHQRIRSCPTHLLAQAWMGTLNTIYYTVYCTILYTIYYGSGRVLSHTSLGSGLDRETPHSVLNLCLGFKGKVGKVEQGTRKRKG